MASSDADREFSAWIPTPVCVEWAQSGPGEARETSETRDVYRREDMQLGHRREHVEGEGTNRSASIARSAVATALLFWVAQLAAPSSAQAWCWWNCSYAKTQYPIVLAHGFLGADSYLGIIDYWYGIEDYIEDKGGTVYVTEVSPANSSSNEPMNVSVRSLAGSSSGHASIDFW